MSKTAHDPLWGLVGALFRLSWALLGRDLVFLGRFLVSRLSSYCQGTANLLPSYCLHTAKLLPYYCQAIDKLLHIYSQASATLLPGYCQATAKQLPASPCLLFLANAYPSSPLLPPTLTYCSLLGRAGPRLLWSALPVHALGQISIRIHIRSNY